MIPGAYDPGKEAFAATNSLCRINTSFQAVHGHAGNWLYKGICCCSTSTFDNYNCNTELDTPVITGSQTDMIANQYFFHLRKYFTVLVDASA